MTGRSLLTFILLWLACICMVACGVVKKPPLAHKGQLDLSDWNFERDGIVELNGEWEFYWKQLLVPGDFSKATPPEKSGGFNIPGRWDGRVIEGQEQSGDGWATFRLRAEVNPDSPVMAVRTPEQATAYRLWVNGVEIAKNGVVGNSPDTSRPQFLLQAKSFPVEAGGETTLELVLQVSNFHYNKGGVWYPIELGNAADVVDAQYGEWALDIFIFGALIVMGFYYLVVYLLRRSELSALYFSFFCTMMAMRAIITDTRFFTHLFPSFPFEIFFTLELLTVTATFPVMLMFFCSLFPAESSPRVVRATQLAGIFFSLIAIVFKARVSTHFIVPYQFVLLFLWFYITWVLIRATKKGRAGARAILIGMSLFYLTVFIDVLDDNDFINTPELASVGMLALVLSQSYGLTRRFAKAFGDVEHLSSELEGSIKAEHYLRQEQLRLARMLDTVEDAVVAVDEAGEISFCNSGLSRLLGHEREQLLSRPMTTLFTAGDIPTELESAISSVLGEEAATGDFHKVELLGADDKAVAVRIELALLDLEDENLAALLVKADNGGPQAHQTPALSVIEGITRNRHRLQLLEDSVEELLPRRAADAHTLRENIRTVDSALKEMGDLLSEKSGGGSNREIAVELMNASLDYWIASSGKGKADFARLSNLWKVYTDRDGWVRTQTLDRYLSLSTMPKLPRWNKIIGSARFVLAHCGGEPSRRERIEALLANLSDL